MPPFQHIFFENRLSIFSVILLTNKQTDADETITSSMEVTIFSNADNYAVYFICRDIIPAGKDLRETNRNLEEITDYMLTLQNETGIKPLWATCNLFSHPRFIACCLGFI